MCCPKADARKITREGHEDARQVARDIAKTKQYSISMRLRKKVEMLFTHLKRILGPGRLRGPCGTNDEFLLAATARNSPRSFLHRSKRAKPDKKGTRVSFRSPLSARATRCFSTESAESGHSLQILCSPDPIGNTPPAEPEENFYAQDDVLDMVARNEAIELRLTRGDSTPELKEDLNDIQL